MFADDSTILFHGKDKSILEEDINSTLSDMIAWLTPNNLKINLDRTNLMVFKNRKQKINNLAINYQGHHVQEVQNTKFLGLCIDNDLSWKSHVEILSSRINQFSYALYMLAKTTNITTLLIAYHGHVASLLRYGIMFWGYSVNKYVVFRSQKRCIRAICKLN